MITTRDLLKEQDSGKHEQIDIAKLDFSKAFNTMPHKKLLEKLEQFGKSGDCIARYPNSS